MIVASYQFDEFAGNVLWDYSGNGHHGDIVGDVVTGVPGIGKRASLFGHGTSLSYVSIPAHPDFSVGTDGMTVEAVVAPSTMVFEGTQAPLCPGFPAANYIALMSKCNETDNEWLLRMYPETAVGGPGCTNRAGRISAYVFNRDGGLGSGSYNQPSTLRVPGVYITVRAAYDPPSIDKPRVHLWVNGVKSPASSGDLYSKYNIRPEVTNADLIIGASLADETPLQFRGAFDSLKIWRGVVAP